MWLHELSTNDAMMLWLALAQRYLMSKTQQKEREHDMFQSVFQPRSMSGSPHGHLCCTQLGRIPFWRLFKRASQHWVNGRACQTWAAERKRCENLLFLIRGWGANMAQWGFVSVRGHRARHVSLFGWVYMWLNCTFTEELHCYFIFC